MDHIVKAIYRRWNAFFERGYSMGNIKRITKHNGWLLLLAWPFLTVLSVAKAFERGGYTPWLAVVFSCLWLAVAVYAIRWGSR